MSRTIELRQTRAKAIADARAVFEAAERENRAMTAEEQERYKKFMQDAEDLRQRIETAEQLAAQEDELRQSLGTVAGGKEQPGDDRNGNPGDEERRVALRKFLRGGVNSLTGQEVRALQADADVTGGYIVAPQQFVNQLIKAVDNAVFLRGLATKFTVERAESLGVPSLDTDISDADWTSELGTGNEDTAMSFGKRELRPHPLAKRIKISNKLLRQAALDPEALVRDRLAYKFGVTEEKAFLTGSGAQQPLGIFTASANGISTSRDVSSGNATDSPQFDGLTRAKYALKAQYWPRARWLFHRNAMEKIALLKDGNGQYIWRESVRDGEPDRVLGLPVLVSEYVPNTFTTGLYVGMLADFSCYWIVDALDMQIQRLVELYAETNQTGFIGRRELDGMPVLEEAFVRVKLA